MLETYPGPVDFSVLRVDFYAFFEMIFAFRV
jgi:hypothetical protein